MLLLSYDLVKDSLPAVLLVSIFNFIPTLTYFQIMNQNIINGLFRSCENGDLQHIVDYFEKNPQTDQIVDDNQITLLQVAAANNQVSFIYY